MVRPASTVSARAEAVKRGNMARQSSRPSSGKAFTRSPLTRHEPTGDGERQFFYFANVPLIKNSERIYVDGNIVPREGYQVKPETGEVKFYMLLALLNGLLKKLNVFQAQSRAPFGAISALWSSNNLLVFASLLRPGTSPMP